MLPPHALMQLPNYCYQLQESKDPKCEVASNSRL